MGSGNYQEARDHTAQHHRRSHSMHGTGTAGSCWWLFGRRRGTSSSCSCVQYHEQVADAEELEGEVLLVSGAVSAVVSRDRDKDEDANTGEDEIN